MELKDFKLPLNVVSQVDVARMIRELDQLEDFFAAAKHRAAGAPVVPPRLSRTLDGIARANHLNLLEHKNRENMFNLLNQVLKSAPMLHISFAAEPQPKFMDQIVAWLRGNIHHQALLQVGLQPTIAAGCVLRTPNKIFDMSLRTYLKQQEPYLVRLIAGAQREA